MWSGFTVSGCTGTSAAEVNGNWKIAPGLIVGGTYAGKRYFEKVGGGTWKFIELSSSWALVNGSDVSAAQGLGGKWPWTVTWTPEIGTIGGTWSFVQYTAPPSEVTIEGAGAPVQATLTTNLTGTNNDLTFTSVAAGPFGNAITLRYVSPGTNNAILAVTVSQRAITVNLATNGSAVITSTAAQVKTALEASTAASELVTVANAPGNDGTGVVTALTATSLAGGSGDGLPLPPVTISL